MNHEDYVNPFSKELALSVYKQNRNKVHDLENYLMNADIDTLDEHKMLFAALEMIGKMTDNTIFQPSISQTLHQRKSQEE